MLRSKLPENTLKTAIEILDAAEKNHAVDLACSVPDFNMSQKLIDSIARHISNGKNQYSPIEGIMPLRQATADVYFQEFGAQYNPETDITITAGSTEAVWTAISAIVHEDDEVIVFEPVYENYVPAIRLNGGTPIFITLKYPDYRIDWNEVIRWVNQRTKMIIISNPHIPTGAVLSEEDMQKLQKIVAGSKIVILSDETYGSFHYDTPISSVAKYPVLAKQSIVISSLGKSFNATGWKTGTCCAPADITAEIRKMHNYICNGSNTAIQYAFSDFLPGISNGELAQVRELYHRKRDLLCDLLKGSKYKLKPTEGSWFQTVDCSEVTPDPDTEFALKLVNQYGVAVFPMSMFYHDKNKSSVIRICFAREDETIKRGVEGLLKAAE
ncbi:MAG: aminotransferase class I/II-fold pyridoxal phosphate-dependent enzyme [Bacteroidales bacterium]|nr:aminotransferase class I/II-fold pyridoxal phosphate-dependent enzyme [Bacteroidales bacterium]